MRSGRRSKHHMASALPHVRRSLRRSLVSRQTGPDCRRAAETLHREPLCTSEAPVKTVESYWPYATTLFDYVKRAMPFNAPGSLSDDDVYSVVAYILSEAKIIKPADKMNATTLPKVVMPNRDGFEPDPRPEVQLYR